MRGTPESVVGGFEMINEPCTRIHALAITSEQ